MAKNDPKWPKVAQIWPQIAQNGPRMTQNDPKCPKNDPKWPKNYAWIYALFPQFFFHWKSGSANIFALRMYGSSIQFWCVLFPVHSNACQIMINLVSSFSWPNICVCAVARTRCSLLPPSPRDHFHLAGATLLDCPVYECRNIEQLHRVKFSKINI